MVLKPNAVVDIAKPGPQLQNLTGMWNARVLDGFTPFVVQFKENGLPVNLTNLTAFIEGDIGEGHYDSATDDIVMTGTPKSVRYTDDGSGNTNMGIVVFRLPPQFFIQTGIFKGFIGLQSSTGIRSTSNDVWFKVLGNSYTMGISCKYFISDLDKALQNFKVKLDQHDQDYQTQLQQVIDDARNAYESETKNAHDSLDALKAQIQANRDEQGALTSRLSGVEQQIQIHDVVTKPEFTKLSGKISDRLAQMKTHPDFYANAQAMQAANPNGNPNLCVTLNDNHQWTYDFGNHQWQDQGNFNYAGIDPSLRDSLYATNTDNLLLNPNFQSDMYMSFGRTDGTPNYSIDADKSNQNANVLTMYGYFTQGSISQSWVVFNWFDIGDHTTLSAVADANISGLTSQDNNRAGIEIDFMDDKGQISRWFNNNPNSSANTWDRIGWQGLQIPANTVKARVGFFIYGVGTIKIRRPQVNFGNVPLPYDYEETLEYVRTLDIDKILLPPITEWTNTITKGSIKTNSDITWRGNQTVNLHADNQGMDQFEFKSSPLIPVEPSSTISVQMPARATIDSSKGQATLDVLQYEDTFDHLVATTSAPIYSSSDFVQIKLDNLVLDSRTTKITIRAALVGNGDLNIGTTSATYKRKQANGNLLFDYPINNWHRNLAAAATADTDSETQWNNQDTLKLMNNGIADQQATYSNIRSPLIKVNPGSKLNLSVPLKVTDTLGAQGAYVEIAQYSNLADIYDPNKALKEFLPTNDSMKLMTFSDIQLFKDTNYVAVSFVVTGASTINIGSNGIELTEDSNEFDKIYQKLGVINPYKIIGIHEYKYADASISKIDEENNLIHVNGDHKYEYKTVQSNYIPVKSNSTISLEAVINSINGNGYLEIHQYNQVGKDLNQTIKVNVNQFNYNGIQAFNNLKIGSTTNFLLFSIVVYNDAQMAVGPISIYDQATAPNRNSNQELSRVLPRFDIDLNPDQIGDKWTATSFAYNDGTRKLQGYLQVGIQGSSSKNYPKKNYKIKLFKDADCKEKWKIAPKAGWTENSKWNLKANYIDPTQARNLVNASLFADATALTPIHNDLIAQSLTNTQSLGQMEGFPVEVYLNGQYNGLYTFNTKKDDKTFGMSDDTKCEVISTYEPSDKITWIQGDYTIGKNYTTEINDKVSPDVQAGFTKLMKFAMESDDADFKAHIADYIDVDSVINCYLWGNLSQMQDFDRKSIELLTYDAGAHWFATLYDLDSTWDLMFEGSGLNWQKSRWSFPDGSAIKGDNNKLYQRLIVAFPDRIKKQYEMLRGTVWRNDQIINRFKQFINSIPEIEYKKDRDRWPDIPSRKVTNLAQIISSIIERGKLMDNYMENHFNKLSVSDNAQPATPVQPTTPQAQPTEPKQ